jgi:hypothetical protein
MSAQPNPQVWYTSSPPLDAVTGEVLLGVRQQALRGDPSLCYLDWGAERGADLDDREVWRQTNPGYEIRISEDFIARERAAMSDEGFARERLGIWPPSMAEQWQLVTEAAWVAALDERSKRSGTVAFAIELSANRQWATIAVAGRRADGLRHVEIVEAERGTGWLVDRMVQLRDRHRPCAVAINPGGPAGALIPSLEAAGVELHKLTEREVAQACGGFVDAIAGPLPESPADPSPRVLRHIGQGVLTTAVAGAITRKMGNARTWDFGASLVDVSPAAAAANASWAFEVYGHNDYDPLANFG